MTQKRLRDFKQFERVLDPDVFAPVNANAWLGLTDVVGSTRAIASGRYNAVNMVGAAAISAIRNRLPGVQIPFVFAGDGSSFVVDDTQLDEARDALARTATWAAEEFELPLRIALVPVTAMRAAGVDLRVAWYRASEGVSYAMLSGGGLAWAETKMKEGAFAIAPAVKGSRPDLAGLSCRWQPVPAKNGSILSLIVRPHALSTPKQFVAVLAEVLKILHHNEKGDGTPIEAERLEFKWPPRGFLLEARAAYAGKSRLRRTAGLGIYTLFARILFATGLRIGAFDPERYRQEVAQNSDFRKFDDGLRMTLDCSNETRIKIEQVLHIGAEKCIVDFGLHEQTSALITCIVSSATANDHLHFVDGADGGYAMAAEMLKRRSVGGS